MKLINNLMADEAYHANQYKIFRKLSYRDVVLAREFSKEDIIYLKELTEQKDILGTFYFEVIESKKLSYKCAIKIDEDSNISQLFCQCSSFKNTGSCSHLIMCFKYYSDLIFAKSNNNIAQVSNKLLKKYSLLNKPVIKKEVKLTIEFNSNESISYYQKKEINYDFSMKINMGVNKMYSLGNHQSRFMQVYKAHKGECIFGKEFVYNYDEFYFNETNQMILNFIYNYTNNIIKDHIYNDLMVNFLSTFKDVPFTFDNHRIESIKECFPLKTFIKKDDDQYIISFDKTDFIPIGKDYEYVFMDGDMYHLSVKERSLLKDLVNNSTDEIIVNQKNVALLTKSILPVIKKNTVLDESVKDEIILVDDPDCELYFDLNNKSVSAQIKLIYNEKIDYFDVTKNILRDVDYETNILNDLLRLGFMVENNKILLTDLDKIVEFIDTDLNELSLKYKTFTTENFKKVNVKRKTNITSYFGIGQDNIMNYNFSLDGIKSEELVNIFKDMRVKKKYYRLKNGDILNLEDKNLTELNNLAEDMEMSDEDIVKGKGEILKYRAIYLDSIKDNKYHIVKTDNLFADFITNFYKYKDSNIDLTTKDLKVLRDYQVIGVKWLYNLAKTGFGGILADEMGLGKTIQVIYYIKEILKEDPTAKFLIVAPTSLVYNWEHEFNLFGKEIKKIIVIGPKNKREQIIKKDINVFITTYGLLREDETLYEDIKYHTMIIDEAQNIKNYTSGVAKTAKKIKSSNHFALTGTPIENSTLELWSIFDFIMPGYLANIQKFQNKYKIRDFNDDTDILIKNLSNQIKPFILRRKKKDVIKELPEKMEHNIYIDLAYEQKKIYVAELEKVQKEMKEILTNEGMSKARFLILQLLTKLRQICIEPKIIFENYNGGSNKIDAFIDIVKEAVFNNHKILVFTSFKTALNIVKEKLTQNGIDSYVIDGSVSSKERMDRVSKFNLSEDGPKVFLIMLKSGGTGLNLAAADIVIHLDLWWNPQAENQATDRAHRIGQKNTVEVIRLITKGTIEEKILELQEKKKKLSDKLIDGDMKDQNLISQLTEADIKKLLSYENEE